MEKFIKFNSKKVKLYAYNSYGNYIIPPHYQPSQISGDGILWVLPSSREGKSQMYKCEKYKIHKNIFRVKITFDGDYTISEFPAIPNADFLGNKFSFSMDNGDEFEKATANFYWLNLLNQIAERTYLRKKKDIRDGYVLSTLNKKAYAGTYPAVDHEFHMKGRFSFGGQCESSLIRRMIELQLKYAKFRFT